MAKSIMIQGHNVQVAGKSLSGCGLMPHFKTRMVMVCHLRIPEYGTQFPTALNYIKEGLEMGPTGHAGRKQPN